ncbi:MAG TPA: hypothetical protein VFW96_18290 [Thermomicrobiales bacterium]|nr:hypothetical protein [Thermomicrobiales bacterium]
METGNPTLTYAVGMDQHRERVARAVANQERRASKPAGAGWRRALAAALVMLAARLAPATQGAPAPLPTATS